MLKILILLVKLPLNYFLLLAFLSTLFSFQSTILVSSFFLTSFINYNYIFKKVSKFSLNNLKFKTKFNFKYQLLFFKKNFIFLNFCLFVSLLTSSFFIKLTNLIKDETKPGTWAQGFSGIYDIYINNNQIYELPLKILNNAIYIIWACTECIFEHRWWVFPSHIHRVTNHSSTCNYIRVHSRLFYTEWIRKSVYVCAGMCAYDFRPAVC